MLTNPWRERTVFIGDAAHAMSPQLGQGVNMALLDAQALAGALATHAHVPHALAHYAHARAKHVAIYQRLSRWLTPLFQSDHALLGPIRGPSMRSVRPMRPLRYPNGMTANQTLTCWAISDGAAGNERQATALAAALDLAPRIVRVHVREPWNALAPRLVVGAQSAIRDQEGRALVPPWPDLAIGCGRRGALVTRALRQWSEARTFAVQILDPRIDPRAFDLVIAPQHDRVAGDNVIRSIGALNPVDARWLAEGRNAFAAFSELPSPRTAVLIGATNSAQRLDAAYFDALIERLGAWHALDAGSYLVSASRRTPRDAIARLRDAFAAWPGVFWAGAEDGANPYAGLLGWADRIVVTPDSVNMICEACATGKPVYTLAKRPIGGRLAAFHRELLASGHLRLFDELTSKPQPPPLAETREIGELVRVQWHKHRPAFL